MSMIDAGASEDSTFPHPKLNSARHKKEFQDYLRHFEGPQGYKVLVMSPRGAFAWLSRASYEMALNDTINWCAERTTLAGCKLFAVGDTIVWDMSLTEQEKVIGAYKASKTPISIEVTAQLSTSAIGGFGGYQSAYDLEQFKVFAYSDDGAWAYRMESTYEDAFRFAMDACDGYARRRGLCRLFAVGDTIVWEMSDKERDAVVERYQTKSDN